MSTDSYLRFVKKGPKDGKPLLWPVWVWKVLYPEPKSISLNLFQQSILGLARARCRDAMEIARLLCLDKDLVNFIIATQLQPNGWMNTDGSLTTVGERVLEEVEDYEEEVRVGYAFQDCISGNWLPRFTESLSIIEPDKYAESGFPLFRWSRDSGNMISPFVLEGGSHYRQDLGELFEAYRKYKNDYENAKQRDGNYHLLNRLNLDRLSYMEDKPKKMWLWVWVFNDDATPEPWLISDPFGHQKAASWLRKPLKELLPKLSPLARYIAGSISQVNPNNVSAVEWLEALENEIDLTILAEYPWSQRVPLIGDYLASVLRRRVAIERHGHITREDLNSLLMETHNLAESTLQWMLKKYPVNTQVLPDKNADKSWDRKLATSVLNSLGLDCLQPDTISRLATQRLSDIRTALIRGSTSMKSLLVAALFSTVEYSEHPLKILTKERLLLGDLLNMADDRNRKAGHAGTEKLSREQVLSHADFTIAWVANFKEWY